MNVDKQQPEPVIGSQVQITSGAWKRDFGQVLDYLPENKCFRIKLDSGLVLAWGEEEFRVVAPPKVSKKQPVKPTYDDMQEAYEEAARHLDYVSGLATDQTEGEREAQRRVAARLRAGAKMLKRY